MKELSLTTKIYNRMEETPKGTIFSNNDFYDLGNLDAVRKALSRLCAKDEIYRLLDGYYTIPYFIDIVQEYSYPTVEQLAWKIADRYAWNVTPFGENALNQVGLSTQVPVVCEYLSDGPYREFYYSNRIIKFKHTSNRMISKYSQPASLIIQSIRALGENNITDKHIRIMRIFTNKYVKENLLEETKSAPAWIYEVIKRIVGGQNE